MLLQDFYKVVDNVYISLWKYNDGYVNVYQGSIDDLPNTYMNSSIENICAYDRQCYSITIV